MYDWRMLEGIVWVLKFKWEKRMLDGVRRCLERIFGLQKDENAQNKIEVKKSV